MLGVDVAWGEAVNKNEKELFNINLKIKLFSFRSDTYNPSLTGAWYDSKNIFMQAGVQKGAGPGRCHQSVAQEWIFPHILHEKHCKSSINT